MISLSISLISLTLVYFILGMFKPEWALLGMKNPSRLLVVVITCFGLMISATLFGEGSKRKQQAIDEIASKPAEQVVTPEMVAPLNSLVAIPAPVTTVIAVPMTVAPMTTVVESSDQ